MAVSLCPKRCKFIAYVIMAVCFTQIDWSFWWSMQNECNAKQTSLVIPLLTHRSYINMMLSMGQCKKDVTPLLTHWSYVFLALTHGFHPCLQCSSVHRASRVRLFYSPHLHHLGLCCANTTRFWLWNSLPYNSSRHSRPPGSNPPPLQPTMIPSQGYKYPCPPSFLWEQLV